MIDTCRKPTLANEADMDLPRVEHFQHLARGGLLNVNFQPRGGLAVHERIRNQGLDDGVKPCDADNGPLAAGEFAHLRFRFVDLPENVLRVPQ
jgi:hypothetical protein